MSTQTKRAILLRGIFILLLTVSAGAGVCARCGKVASSYGPANHGLSKQTATESAVATDRGLIVLPTDSPKLSRIKVQPAQLAMFPVAEVVAPGKVEVNPNRVSRVVMPVPGRIRLIEKGEPIRAELSAYPGEVFRARVMRIADTVDPQTRTIKVEAEIANPEGRLRPEMFGQIRHDHGTKAMLAVPPGAVLQKEARNVVLLEQAPGRFRERSVTVGIRKDNLVPILSGISAGDRVVVDGAMLLGKE